MKLRIFAFLGALALTTGLAFAADSIDNIASNNAVFDGKSVTVTGTVSDVKAKTSKRGNDYTTFDICATKCIGVYVHGHPTVANGTTVTVTGDYTASKSMGSFTITNQISADDDPILASPAPAPAASSQPGQ